MASPDSRLPRTHDVRTPAQGRARRDRTDYRTPNIDQDGVLATQWADHYGELVRYATYLLSGDTHAAEDIAQETAIRLWRHPEILAADQPLSRWLRTVARHIVVDRSRRRRARPTEVTLAPGIDRASPDALGHIEAEAAVATILSDLSPQHRAVVVEVYVRDRPVADVAEALGIPTGTVKSRCHTALRQLRSAPLPACT